jgi:hypothetical protein
MDTTLFKVMFWVGLAIAGGDAASVWGDWQFRRAALPEPTAVRLADLTAAGAGGNLHVRVTDLRFGSDYVYKTSYGSWDLVFVPVLADGRVRALVKSSRVQSAEELPSLVAQPAVTGVVVNDRYTLGTEEANQLAQKYPGVNFASLPVIDDRKAIPTIGQMALGVAGGVLCLAVSAAGAALWLAERRRPRPADGGEEPAAPPPAVLADVEGLGELRRTFPTDPGVKALLVMLLTAFAFITGVAVVLVPSAKPRDFVLARVIGGVFELVPLALIVVFLPSLNDAAALYAGGLASRSRRKTASCRWDEVESASGLVWVPRQTEGAYAGGPIRLRCADGKTVTVGSVDGGKELLDAVRAEVLGRQLPRALEAIRKGDSVACGPLRPGRRGISGPGDQSLLWVEVGDVEVSTDKIVVREARSGKPWWSGNLQTPDAALMLELVEAGKRGDLR